MFRTAHSGDEFPIILWSIVTRIREKFPYQILLKSPGSGSAALVPIVATYLSKIQTQLSKKDLKVKRER
jgi:hypothetical protein